MYQDLKHRGYRCFLDREDLMSGEYEIQVKEVISGCTHVIIILPENALDRCHESDDLFRKEIALSIQLEKNIISIVRQGFVFPSADSLPDDIRKFPQYEAIIENPNAYDSVIQRLCTMLKDSKRKIRRERLKSRRTLLAVSLLVFVMVFSSVFGVMTYRKKPADILTSYEYPREANKYYEKIIDDSGQIQNLFMGLNTTKFFERVNIEESSDMQSNVSEYMIHLKNVSSFPFEGETAVLGEYEDLGEYPATVIFMFYQNCCEYCNYALATDDEAQVRKMMKKLYQKYNNGSGEIYENGYIIRDVQEFGGNLIMQYGKNAHGQNCFFWQVYREITPDSEEKIIGNLEISDYLGMEFVTYNYNDEISAKGKIYSVQAERSDYNVRLTIEGEKTYGMKDGTGRLEFGIRVLNSEGIVIATSNFHSPNIKTGEKFKVNTSVSINKDFYEDDICIEFCEKQEGF